MEKNSFAMAISELRGALKIDPNHSTCHGLLGKAYLQQNQPTMAKVHMNKAWNSNPKDPVAIECKKLLDKHNPDFEQNNPKIYKSLSSMRFVVNKGGIVNQAFGVILSHKPNPRLEKTEGIS